MTPFLSLLNYSFVLFVVKNVINSSFINIENIKWVNNLTTKMVYHHTQECFRKLHLWIHLNKCQWQPHSWKHNRHLFRRILLSKEIFKIYRNPQLTAQKHHWVNEKIINFSKIQNKLSLRNKEHLWCLKDIWQIQMYSIKITKLLLD